MGNKKWIGLLVLLVRISSIIIYHIFGYIGHYGYDDMEYAKLASDLNNGFIDYNNHFTFRLPIILLTAISYSFFGVTDFASSLPPIITTISIQLLVFLALKNKGTLTLILALALTTFSNWFIFYSDKLMPDIYLVLFVMLSLFIIQKYKFESSKNKTGLYAIFLSLSLFMGFLAKETIVLMIPLLLYFVIIDFINKRDIKFWIYSFLSGLLLLVIYFAIVWILTGDFAKRFEAISQNSYLNLCSYDQQPLQILLKRLAYEFFSLSIAHTMFTGFIFVIAYLFQTKAKNVFKFNDLFSFYFVSAIILLLSSNFMTISVTSYVPMCLDPRHYLFLIPIVSIPAAFIITDFVKTRQHTWPILLVLLVVSTFSFFLQINYFWNLYLPLTVLFALMFLLRKYNKYQSIFMILFVLVLMKVPFDKITYAKQVNYRKQKEIVYKNIIDKNFEGYVITSDVEKRLCEYYNGFNNKSGCIFINFNEFKPDSLEGTKKLLLLNWYTQYLSGMDFNDLPFYAKEIDSTSILIYEDKKLNLSLHELKSISTPEHNGNEIVTSFNDFEQVVPFWDNTNRNTAKDEKYEGEYCEIASEYSSTFIYPLDSLPIKTDNFLVISTKLFCNFDKNTNAKIVVSIEANEGTYIWQSLEVNKYLKAYSIGGR
ncbi:MAG: glycosyltransferase family 39 protein [Salinivirgaceae bacterium]